MTTVEQDLELALSVAEMHRRASYTALGIAAAFVILFVFMFCRLKSNVIPPKDQKTIDSLAITQPTFDSSRQATITNETGNVTQSATNARQARQALRAADSLHRLAIIAQQRADAARDTLSRWFTVATLRGVENDSLRSANRGLDSALAQQTEATHAADRRAALDSARRVALADLSAKLASDVKTAGQCRVAGFISCPTRTATAITFTIVGVGLKTMYDRRKP
jgi:hypothetical protein